MAWEQYVIETAATDLERLERALLESGAIAVSLEDAGDAPILEPGPGETPLWPRMRVRALFEAGTVPPRLVDRLATMLPDGAVAACELLADEDWSRAWLAHSRALWFGDRRLCVSPAELAPRADRAGAAIVVLEPGLAFGTGSHPSTAACLEWLATADLAGARVLDYGCGSGVLAIAACLLGARRATAVDIDPQALAACLENARRNGCAGRVSVLAPERLAACGYDVVLANILARPLLGLAQQLSALVREGGSLVLAGLLGDQAEAVRRGYAPFFDFAPARRHDEWVSLAGVRRRDEA
jgi:ribosomal protein L11 methyltransferase